MLRKILKIFGRTLLIVLVLLVVGVLGAAGYLYFTRPHTPQFKDVDGRVIPGSIAALQELELGGSRQWVLIRGRDIRNPFLLFLHGARACRRCTSPTPFQRELEKDFVVVNGTAGSGKSYSKPCRSLAH
jgi:hypothetical protein